MLELLQDLSTRSSAFEKGQAEVMSALAEVQRSQNEISGRMSDVCNSLTVVEARVGTFEQVRHDIEKLKSENVLLKSRLSDLEDRSRRDNLVFHGITDAKSETWTQTEAKLLTLINEDLGLQISSEAIERSHRIGSYVEGKTRPIIAKFASFKARDLVYQARRNVSSKSVAVTEDFSASTRLARKKLIVHGKSCNALFEVRYNKLFVNNKCFMYDPINDSAYEVNSYSAYAMSRNDEQRSSQSTSNAAAVPHSMSLRSSSQRAPSTQ